MCQQFSLCITHYAVESLNQCTNVWTSVVPALLCTDALCEPVSATWRSLTLDPYSSSVFLSLSLYRNEEQALKYLKTTLWRAKCSFSPHCVWHLAALVWASSRACLVSLPSSILFPDFLCMLWLVAGLCVCVWECLSCSTFILNFHF